MQTDTTRSPNLEKLKMVCNTDEKILEQKNHGKKKKRPSANNRDDFSDFSDSDFTLSTTSDSSYSCSDDDDDLLHMDISNLLSPRGSQSAPAEKAGKEDASSVSIPDLGLNSIPDFSSFCLDCESPISRCMKHPFRLQTNFINVNF